MPIKGNEDPAEPVAAVVGRREPPPMQRPAAGRDAEQIRQAEHERFAFVQARDGREAALDFARRILQQYRAALAERNQAGFRTGYGLAYSRELAISCSVLRAILRTAKDSPDARNTP